MKVSKEEGLGVGRGVNRTTKDFHIQYIQPGVLNCCIGIHIFISDMAMYWPISDSVGQYIDKYQYLRIGGPKSQYVSAADMLIFKTLSNCIQLAIVYIKMHLNVKVNTLTFVVVRLLDCIHNWLIRTTRGLWGL